MPPIYPMLTPPDALDTETFVARQLTETDEYEVPLVAFARFDEQGGLSYISRDAIKKKGHGIGQLEAAAMKNLVNRGGRPDWKPENISFGQGEVTILRRQGDLVTASDILDRELTNIAQNYFSCEQLFIAVPTQAIMLAADDGMHLAGLVNHYCRDAAAPSPPLSPLIFCLEKGEIIGIAEFEDVYDAGATRPEPTLYHVNGANALWFSMNCRSFDELFKAIQFELAEHGPKLGSRDGFQGRVIFDVEAGSVALSQGERQQLVDLTVRLNHEVAKFGWASPYGEHVAVSIQLPGEAEGGAAGKSAPDTKQKAGKSKKKWRAKTVAGPQVAELTATSSGMKLRGKKAQTKPGGKRGAKGREAPGRRQAAPAQGGGRSLAELRRSIPNKLGTVIAAIRVYYLVAIAILVGTGFYYLNAPGRLTAEAVKAGLERKQEEAPEADDGEELPAEITQEMVEKAMADEKFLLKGFGQIVMGICVASLIFNILIWEFVIILGLKRLRGWARLLSILGSIFMLLSMVAFPFGILIFLGLFNNGTIELFDVAQGLRRQRVQLHP